MRELFLKTYINMLVTYTTQLTKIDSQCFKPTFKHFYSLSNNSDGNKHEHKL